MDTDSAASWVLPAMSTLLFLCTGNYYRSRFAEHYFNYLAVEKNLSWKAESRGLEPWPGNPGPISVHTARALEMLQIDVGELRMPLAVTQEDFDRAAHVIAVKEAEHRDMMARLFPSLADKVEYWHVHDLDCSLPDDTICHLKREVEELVERLRGNLSAKDQ